MDSKEKKPPKIAARLLQYFLPFEMRNTAPGDFEEEYVDIVEANGVLKAWIWYWTQVTKSIFLFVNDSIMGIPSYRWE